jgi:hypothetical protein
MGIRGPKSAEALVTPTVVDLRGDDRPEPPEDLTEEQAAEWRAGSCHAAAARGSWTKILSMVGCREPGVTFPPSHQLPKGPTA